MAKSTLKNALIVFFGLDIIFPSVFKTEKYNHLSKKVTDFYSRPDFMQIIKAYHNNDFRREGKTLIFSISNDIFTLTDKMVNELQFHKIQLTDNVKKTNKEKEKVAA